MTTVSQALALAMRHFRAGNFQAAEAVYQQILQVDPKQPDALHFLGAIALQQGKAALAVEYMKQSIAVAPSHAGLQYNLGSAYQALGQIDLAVASYQEALRLQPDFAEVHINLGNALADQGKLDEAIASYQLALAIKPNLAMAHYNIGHALTKQGQHQAAVESYQQALRLEPNLADVHFSLGNVQKKLGRLDAAAASYRLALLLRPDYAEVLYNLGLVLVDQKKLEDAAACYREALRLKADWADAHASLGTVLSEQGKAEHAVASLQHAVRLSPNARLRIALATRLPVIYQSVAELERWRDRLIREIRLLREQEVVHDLTEEPALNLFYLAYQGCNDRDILSEAGRLYRAPDRGSEPLAIPPARSEKIRVGVLSSFFRNHTVGHWMRGLIAKLSRESFEVTVLSIGRSQDSIVDFIQKHSDRYLEVPRHLPSARRLIGEQHLDVLLYAEIGMVPITYTLAFSRLAPVQCVTVGHPVTTGIDTIDYFISSGALETVGADEHYSEKLIRLKDLPVFYYRPETPAPLKARTHFGFAAEDHIYVCPQTLFKFHPEFDPVLAGILRGDPRGVLVLFRSAVPHWEQLLRQRFAVTMPDVVDRVRLVPYQAYADYLNLLAVADVQLDTLHFGGGNTSYDGLTVGTPIVTLPSPYLRGRITTSLYQKMQVLDCLAHDSQQYIDIALRLGMDADYRQAVRHKILAANSVLFENSEGVQELERFLLQVVQASRQKE